MVIGFPFLKASMVWSINLCRYMICKGTTEPPNKGIVIKKRADRGEDVIGRIIALKILSFFIEKRIIYCLNK